MLSLHDAAVAAADTIIVGGGIGGAVALFIIFVAGGFNFARRRGWIA